MQNPTAKPATRPTYVVCDRCRAQGFAGEDPIAAFGALLDFEPVPRRSSRADGWDAEVQRAFIAALSLTGSDRAAARAVGRAAYGVTQLLAHEGSDGFRAAREEAMAMAADERSRRLAEGVQAVSAEQAGWRPADPPWAGAATRRPPEPEPEAEEDDSLEAREAWLIRMINQYLMKLQQERDARTSGEIVAADFYLRQATWIEVALDLLSGDAILLLRDFRLGGYSALEIAETTCSKILDAARRDHWVACGDPPRPEIVPRRLLNDHGGFATEPLESIRGGPAEFRNEQKQAYEDEHRQAAADQIFWEEAARRDYEERRARDASSMSRDAACRPACRAEGEDTFDVTDSRRSTESKAEDAQQRSDLVERCAAAADVRSESDTIDAA
ncbi:MAG TPA: hypothetical protein VF662_14420, partial [Allosphingosinicella sp.]